ncbi:MAG TPA: NrfD/PsrC family molybdoenzyme membrane anchor subunit [Candidatus Dormibacteraeota bacterium]
MPGEHFVAAPHWEWYILLYFFLAGLSGGAFVIGTMLRVFGSPADWPAARIAFLISFPLLVLCPILLTIDLGKPLDFWHMLIDTSGGGLSFKIWSPMSLGAWGLLLFGIFSFVMFLVALGDAGYWQPVKRLGVLATSPFGLVVMIIGAILGIFIAAYTGVLLAVSNQPVWSDTWSLGALFLASGLSGAAATVILFTQRHRQAALTHPKLIEADRYFLILELVLILVFLIGLGGIVSRVLGGGWIILWLIVLIGTVVPLVVQWRPALVRQVSPLLTMILVLAGVLALRAVIIFSAQA